MKTTIYPPIMIGIGALIMLVVIYFIGKSYGKSIPPKQVTPPDDDPGTTTSTLSIDFIRAITDDLYSDLDGWTWSSVMRALEPYEDLSALSDTDFVRVYNDWTDRYYKEFGNETLRQAINNEIVWPFALQSTMTSIENRFSRLNLT